MKKVSLLAASVAIALTGCGGSDSGSGSNGNVAPGGVIVTGFDGYFNNAVVFADTNNNGAFDVNTDQILGLTAPLKGKDGQLEIKTAEFNAIKEKQTRLGLQTLVPGGDVQTALIAKDPSLYAGKYTIDMDHPTQAMAHEVALFTLPGEKVISPLTDLVVVQAGANPTEEIIAQAKKKVNETLGISGDTAFSDVIAAQNHTLHKTAQILTESKVKAEKNSGTYDAETALIIAQEATTIVNDANNADKLDDPSFKPTVEVENGQATVTINNKLSVNSNVEAQVRTSLSTAQESHTIALDINTSAEINGKTVNLFADKDANEITVTVEVIDYDTNQVILSSVGENGAVIHVDGDLTKGGTLQERLSYMVKVSANDINSDKKVVGNAAAIFNLKVAIPNSAPVVDQRIAATMQEWIGSIKLFAGVELTEQKEIITNLFTDEDANDTLLFSAKTSVEGLKAEIVDNAKLHITGKPTKVYPAGETITVEAFDGKERTAITFKLAAVEEAPVPSFSVNNTELANLQSEITSQLVDLKVNEPLPSVQLSITLDDIFKAVNAHGPVEYFAGMKGENQDHNTSVAGIKVAVDSMGVLTISGTPLEASTNGEFYIAAGIYPDAEDGVISEMTRIALPEVKAVVTPPSETHPLEGKTWYRLEHGNGTPEEKLPYSRIWCDTLHFENGKVSGNYRTMSNLTQCGELAENSWSNGTYRVEGDQVIAQFGDDPDATLTIRDADDIAPGAKVLFWTSDEGTERYTLFSNKSDAEARIQIRSDDGPEKRFFNMPLPTEVNGVEALGMVSLSLLRNNNPDDTGAMNANLTLEFPDQNFTCENVQEFYENFIITGPGLVTETTDYNTGNVYKTYGVYSGNQWGTSLECHPNDENGVEHATIDFDLPELTTHGLYSFIGKVKSHQGEYIEAIKFNMTWTGTGNNE
ncbi:hypothetical protein VVYB158_12050 [Vibrio vulnificus CladeA-yb158]|uniref:hypothetical protein n=1 Tax=Vibrio vulnificus TaxID=672 RepID=UPI00063DDA39|nr:hypothetical protein [Vibrio vulnificus]EJV9415494.1 hypothetical protein [Vibrio vulnificus]KLI67649.1 hypothetical protein VVYB158_12050 [Vibrio vulnificus CladeA-yb158]OJI39374.1 hypothetical protein VVDAL7940_01182 [Vibrio vulnificus]HAT8553060.1 hypothetical protein [Vibrio vulnificus]